MSLPGRGAETVARPNATPQTATRYVPEFDVAGLYAQITSNALAFATMSYTLRDVMYSKDKPSPIIVTTNEAGGVRAAIIFPGALNGKQMMRTLFQGSLAGTDSEALVSLYHVSKQMTTRMKQAVENDGRWFRG